VDLKTGKEDSKDSTNFMVRVIQSNKCVLCCSAPLWAERHECSKGL